MISPHEFSADTLPPDRAPAPESASSRTNPALTANLSAECEALRNDLDQARELASDFQSQLAGKSNEFATMKQVFEKTLQDLTQLQTSIAELRQERHQLANDAMRAVAFQHKLTGVTAERDRLQAEAEPLRQALAAKTKDAARQIETRDARIAQLVAEADNLADALAAAERGSGKQPFRRQTAPDAQSLLAQIATSVDQLTKIIGPGKRQPLAREQIDELDSGVEQFIQISFDR